MDDLKGKTALVTGASRGIGREVSMALAAAGCQVALGYHHDKTGAESVAAEIHRRGGKAVALDADVANPQGAADLVRATEAKLGPLGIVVNNAGINPSRTPEQITSDDWRKPSESILARPFTSRKPRYLGFAHVSGDGSSRILP